MICKTLYREPCDEGGESVMRCIGLEMKKNLHWPYVLLSVAGIACLGFCGTVFDPSGAQTTLFGLARQIHEGGIIPDISMSVPVIWQQGLGSWLALFAPLLVTFGYVVTLSSERQNGQMKFELIRGGNFRYSVSKAVSGALFSGVMFLAGYALFGFLLKLFFPAFSSFGEEQQWFYLSFYPGNSVILFCIYRLAGAFFFGVFAGVFGIGVAVFLEDKYMLICLPFLLNYIYQQVLQKAVTGKYAAGAESAVWLESFYPASFANLSASRYWAVPVLVLGLIYFGIVLAFWIRLKRGRVF